MSTRWLVGLAESRDDSHPGWDGVGWLKISSPHRMAHNLKLELFVSGIFIYYFWTSLGCSLQELQKRKQRLCRDYCSFWGVYYITLLEAFEKIWVYFSHPHFYRVGSSCYLFIKGLLEVEVSSSKALKNYSWTQTPNQRKSFW